MPTRKPEPPTQADDLDQSKRFIDMAREVKADERPERFEKAFDKVARSKTDSTHKALHSHHIEKPTSS
jgi:hypothetical protein